MGNQWGAVWAVFEKDCRAEWRSRAALNSIALFSIAAPIAASFSVARQNLEPELLGGLLWTVLLFAALVGMSRAFVKEEEAGTAAQLRLAFSSDAVFWGKALFNLVLLVATQCAAVPLFAILLGARLVNPSLLLVVLVCGDVGLAMASALLGAIASVARARGSLFAAISVPVLLPLLISASVASAGAFGAHGDSGFALEMMALYDLIIGAAVWMLFDSVWSA